MKISAHLVPFLDTKRAAGGWSDLNVESAITKALYSSYIRVAVDGENIIYVGSVRNVCGSHNFFAREDAFHIFLNG